MAEIVSVLGAIATSASILNHLAKQTERWRSLSDRLFDIREGLDSAELSLESWQRKYDYQERRPAIYMHVLFGRLGWDRIQITLGSIKRITKAVQSDVHKAVGRALAARPTGRSVPDRLDDRYAQELVEDCLYRIKRNTSWSRKFVYSVFNKIEDLEMQLDRP